MELELIKSMFNKFTYYETNCSHALIKPFMRDYSYLEVRIPIRFIDFIELLPKLQR